MDDRSTDTLVPAIPWASIKSFNLPARACCGGYRPSLIQMYLSYPERRQAIARAESEIVRLRDQMANRGLSAIEAELLHQELKTLRSRNLQESTFEERADLVAKLGIKILPSEDMKSMEIFCRLNLAEANEKREQAGFAKVTLGGAEVSIGRTSELLFSPSI